MNPKNSEKLADRLFTSGHLICLAAFPAAPIFGGKVCLALIGLGVICIAAAVTIHG